MSLGNTGWHCVDKVLTVLVYAGPKSQNLVISGQLLPLSFLYSPSACLAIEKDLPVPSLVNGELYAALLC